MVVNYRQQRRRAEFDLLVTELAMAGMASADESAMPCVGPFPSVTWALGPSLILCHVGLRPE